MHIGALLISGAYLFFWQIALSKKTDLPLFWVMVTQVICVLEQIEVQPAAASHLSQMTE